MEPLEVVEVTVTVKNTGSSTWTAATNYRLGSQAPQDNSFWTTGRKHLGAGESIAPGDAKTFTFSITAPEDEGTYLFQWRMLREHVEWFGEFTPLTFIQVKR
jgi:hypothetical protein